MNPSRLLTIGYPSLVVAIILFILVPSHLRMFNWYDEVGAGTLHYALFMIIMLAALLPIAVSRRQVGVAIVLAIGVLISWYNAGQDVTLFEVLAQLVFVAYICLNLLLALARAHEASFETICAAICFYLLIALNWAHIFMAIEMVNPGSFTLDAAMPMDEKASSLLYFSFVTISSLGYGDIYPIEQTARGWAFIEVIFGQFYLAVIVARLVAMQLSPRPKPTD